ncbi:MAG: homoserine dehydrogenase [Eubacteriales bacterium]|nr:homoserine dehydrogenase [Eubacteriales bacterium]
MIKTAILGYGTVGSGVAQVLSCNRDLIAKRVGDTLEVKYILDLRDFPGDPFEDRIVHDIDTILEDPEISIVCETMGGNEPAYTFSRRALEAGKSVCTSNKELVANHGAELIRTAREHCCNYLFEASVGGGIPIIRPLNCALTAERVLEISGILNGTTNYILTKMEQEQTSFGAALSEAQRLGYAEKNPEADVEGHDACRKIAILTSLMAGRTVDFQEIHTEGISGIEPQDFAYAKKLHMTIKLLAVSREKEEGYQAYVAPCLLDKDQALAGVNDVFNAIFVHGNTLGESMFYGRGAGKLPTASAVVSDMVDCARHPGIHIGCLWEPEKQELTDYRDLEGRFFVRMKKSARLQAEKVFAPEREVWLEELPEEYGFVTSGMSEREFVKRQEQVPGLIKRIRIKD